MFGMKKKEPETGAKLVAINRNGRMNVFTFERNGEHFEIETMGMLSDDVPGWKKKAGLE